MTTQRRNEVGLSKPHLSKLGRSWTVRCGTFFGLYPTYDHACEASYALRRTRRGR